jgi:hypothetical protein
MPKFRDRFILIGLGLFIGNLLTFYYYYNEVTNKNAFTDPRRVSEMETLNSKANKLKLDGSYCSSDLAHQSNNEKNAFMGLCRVSEMETEASKANKLKLNGSHCVSDYDDEKLARLVGCPWSGHPGCSHFPVKVIFKRFHLVSIISMVSILPFSSEKGATFLPSPSTLFG